MEDIPKTLTPPIIFLTSNLLFSILTVKPSVAASYSVLDATFSLTSFINTIPHVSCS